MIPAHLPPWVVMHIPHDATTIPGDVRGQFLGSDEEIREELLLMTDHFTHSLFARPADGDVTLSAFRTTPMNRWPRAGWAPFTK